MGRPWCWESLKAGGEADDRGQDIWVVAPTQWTWVWASSGRWWRTGKPGVLQPMGCKKLDTNEWLNYNNIALVLKNLLANAGDLRNASSYPWVRKIPWRRAWQPTPFLPGKSHGQRSLERYSPWNHQESYMTEATQHTSSPIILSFIIYCNFSLFSYTWLKNCFCWFFKFAFFWHIFTHF